MVFNILVTGGAGYIGSILVLELLKLGHKVTVVEGFLYGSQSLLSCCAFDTFQIHRGDVRDKELIKKLIRDKDVILPLAALVGAPICDKNQVGAVTINRDAVKTLTELLSSDQRIIYPNTNSGYGIGQPGIHCTEETPLNPVSLYGRTKVEAEKVVLDRENAISLRLATVFGTSPRMRLDLLVNDFTYQAVSKRFLVVYEGHFMRNYIHIRDAARAFIHALDNFEQMKNQAYNIGLSDANLSKLELCDKIKEQVPDFVYTEAALTEDVDKRDYIISHKKIEKTGFRPMFSLEMGIAELIKCYTLLGDNISAYSNNVNTLDDYTSVNIQGITERRLKTTAYIQRELNPPNKEYEASGESGHDEPAFSWHDARTKNEKERILISSQS